MEFSATHRIPGTDYGNAISPAKRPTPMEVPEFFDTEIHCKDGKVCGERSFLRRVCPKWKAELQGQSLPCKLLLPEETVADVAIFIRYLNYMVENTGLGGPGALEIENGDFKPFPDVKSRVSLCEFLIRNKLDKFIWPFLYEVKDPEEADALMELVKEHPEQIDDPEGAIDSLSFSILQGILRAAEGNQNLNISLDGYKAAWRIIGDENMRPAFMKVFSKTGYDEAELEDEEQIPELEEEPSSRPEEP